MQVLGKFAFLTKLIIIILFSNNSFLEYQVKGKVEAEEEFVLTFAVEI